jgi:hypothetical protein
MSTSAGPESTENIVKDSIARSICMFLIVWSLATARSPLHRHIHSGQEAVVSQEVGVCPTGKSCGANADYCQAYAPPRTEGARVIHSLPYRITSSGNYYLASDLTSEGTGIAVLANNVDINLNGFSLTYGAGPAAIGSEQIGEYGILICNEGNLNDESLNTAYGSNRYCARGGLSANNVTIENGKIIQSPNAPQYYDPNNCPGSGVEGSCHHRHDVIASHAIDFFDTHAIKVTHVTITIQNVDSMGIHFAHTQPGSPAYDIECNTIHDKVVQLNDRQELTAPIWTAANTSATAPGKIIYNTLIGSPQGGIATSNGNGTSEPRGTTVSYNDVALGYYQGSPYQSQFQMYSNDYAIMACIDGGSIAYNYVHNSAGRGIGCVYGRDQQGTSINNNYVSTGEGRDNAEYGPNGNKQGAAWIGACDFSGTRGFEAKDTMGFTLAFNTFIVNASTCGGPAIELAELPCISISGCLTPASQPINIHDNNEEAVITSGATTLAAPNYVTCVDLQTVQGNYSNYFAPILRDNCTSDGDYVNSEGYAPGDYFTFENATYKLGNHVISSGCGLSSLAACGHMMHWQGISGQGIPDELGYVFQDINLANGATLSFHGESTTPTARGATVQWTYTATVSSSVTRSPIEGATVTATDAGGNVSSCQTNSSGQCPIEIRQQTVSSPAVEKPVMKTNHSRGMRITIAAAGCSTLTFPVSSARTTTEPHVLTCE